MDSDRSAFNTPVLSAQLEEEISDSGADVGVLADKDKVDLSTCSSKASKLSSELERSCIELLKEENGTRGMLAAGAGGATSALQSAPDRLLADVDVVASVLENLVLQVALVQVWLCFTFASFNFVNCTV